MGFYLFIYVFLKQCDLFPTRNVISWKLKQNGPQLSSLNILIPCDQSTHVTETNDLPQIESERYKDMSLSDCHGLGGRPWGCGEVGPKMQDSCDEKVSLFTVK